MNLLITGSHGFLGKHLQNEVSKYPYINPLYPTSKQCDLLNYSETLKYFSLYKPDVILHAAAVCAGIFGNLRRSADFITQNIQMGLNVYEAAKECNIKTIHTLGSVCSFPSSGIKIPFKEDDLWNGKPEITNFPYGHSKRTLLLLGTSYRQQYGITGSHVIPVNMYGTHDNFNLITSHVIPAMIRKFYEAKFNNDSQVKLWGTGRASREFLFGKDAGEAILKAIAMNLDTELPINLGTGKEIFIKDLAQLIAELVEYNGEIIFDGSVSDGQPRRCLDVSRAKEILGWEAKTDFKTGLKETIEWYKENRDNIFAKENK